MSFVVLFFFFFNDTATTEIYTLSLHDALPIWIGLWRVSFIERWRLDVLSCSAGGDIQPRDHGRRLQIAPEVHLRGKEIAMPRINLPADAEAKIRRAVRKAKKRGIVAACFWCGH